MQAHLRNYRQSPRKVRLVVDQIRGKRVADALAFLSFTSKRASLPIKKLLESAVANAKNNFKTEADDLIVSKCSVDQGVTMWRFMPRARGATSPIHKRTCHVSIELSLAKKPEEKVGKSSAGAKLAGGKKKGSASSGKVAKARRGSSVKASK